MNRRELLAACLIAACLSAGLAGAPALPPRAQAGQSGALDLLFEQGKRLFDQFSYDEAVKVFNQLINTMTVAGQTPRQDLLVQAYELRARSRFALGDTAGAEQDFAALLGVQPDFKLGSGISPRVVAAFEGVRKITVGQVSLQVTPAGEVMIDGKPVQANETAQVFDMTSGEHTLTAARPGHRPLSQSFTIAPATVTPVAITLERVSATLTVRSLPEGAEVVLDGKVVGTTARAPANAGQDAGGVFVINDLAPGDHRLLLRRDCHVSVEQTISAKPEDIDTEVMRLAPAIADVAVRTNAAGAAVFVDGIAKGAAPANLEICEGSHLIEVRGPKGRFADRRAWKPGEKVTLDAELRSAFPIVVVRGDANADQLRATVERAMAPAKQVMLYTPAASELQSLKDEIVPVEWLAPPPADGTAATSRVPADVTRELGKKFAARLGVQGVAAVTAGSQPYLVTISLLAAGSADPDVITINLSDPASTGRAMTLLGSSLPPIVRPSLETAFIDVAGTPGAVVVRVGGTGAKAGLAVGDVIVNAGGRPIASVADLRARIATVAPPALDLPLEVKSASGASRKVSATLAMIADTIPMRDSAIVYNRALLDLQEAAGRPGTPAATAAAKLNLAIVHMRLGNWDDAQAALKDVQLPDGPGVSAGTVAYLTGLCAEATGRSADAQAAFTKAAASTLARLWNDGPLVAPLAQAKLGKR
ncbi:MAG TPA: hypothetical protein VFV98_17320 [Vicinamibacterales bacterium]|nr:hypothetical protein [Vicinamibacterales bacterium]